MDLFKILKSKINGKDIKIVFPEGIDPRILGAASKLYKEKLIIPVLLGDVNTVNDIAKENSIDIEGIEVIDPNKYADFDNMVQSFVERRKGKATLETANKLLRNINYFGTMLTYLGKVDGMVSGAINSTGETVRPALQIIKTKPGVSRTSGAFIMLGNSGEKYLFSDCAINVTLSDQEMAEIAVQSAQTAELFDIDPKVAMLSFSTKGSAESSETDKVVNATKIAKKINPDLVIDGELQFDAAIVPSVANKKAPGSPVAGKATVFIFPTLDAGNIGYKIAQRLGGYQAIGPILQGLNKPISDLSRGCSEEDVYKLSIITAAQSLSN